MFRKTAFYLLLSLSCGSAWATSIVCNTDAIVAESDVLKGQIGVSVDGTTTQISIPVSFKNEPFVWAVAFVGDVEAPQAIVPLDTKLKDNKYQLSIHILDPSFKAVIRVSYGELCGYAADIEIGT